MKIIGADIIHMRNMPVPKVRGKAQKMPDRGMSTVVQLHVQDDNGETAIGLGEIRTLSSITRQTPKQALSFARRLARRLMNAEMTISGTGMEIARETHDVVAAVLREHNGIADDSPVPATIAPSVRFAFDCALLDAVARLRGESVVSMLGGEADTITHNVIPGSFGRPGEMINRLLRSKRRAGWIRADFKRSGNRAPIELSAVAAAMGGQALDKFGAWFKLGNRWKEEDFNDLAEALDTNQMLRNAGLSVVLEQPFHLYATRRYRNSFASPSMASGQIRIILSDGLASAEGLDAIAEYLPHVDLKITPQACGSVHDVNRLLTRARELGFKGSVYLGTVGSNTEMNTLYLLALAQLLDDVNYFSARPGKETRIKQVWPQVSADETESGLALSAPEGDAGWNTELCRSSLEKRLVSVHFVRADEETPDRDAALAALIAGTFDDMTKPSEAEAGDDTAETDEEDMIEAEDDAGEEGGRGDNDDEGTVETV